jgi:hypothetical protein
MNFPHNLCMSKKICLWYLLQVTKEKSQHNESTNMQQVVPVTHSSSVF